MSWRQKKERARETEKEGADRERGKNRERV